MGDILLLHGALPVLPANPNSDLLDSEDPLQESNTGIAAASHNDERVHMHLSRELTDAVIAPELEATTLHSVISHLPPKLEAIALQLVRRLDERPQTQSQLPHEKTKPLYLDDIVTQADNDAKEFFETIENVFEGLKGVLADSAFMKFKYRRLLPEVAAFLDELGGEEEKGCGNGTERIENSAHLSANLNETVLSNGQTCKEPEFVEGSSRRVQTHIQKQSENPDCPHRDAQSATGQRSPKLAFRMNEYSRTDDIARDTRHVLGCAQGMPVEAGSIESSNCEAREVLGSAPPETGSPTNAMPEEDKGPLQAASRKRKGESDGKHAPKRNKTSTP